jgi:hypothetical protein
LLCAYKCAYVSNNNPQSSKSQKFMR